MKKVPKQDEQVNLLHIIMRLQVKIAVKGYLYIEWTGKVEGMTAKLHTNQDAQPMFLKVCLVPYALQTKVEELDRWETDVRSMLCCPNHTSSKAR